MGYTLTIGEAVLSYDPEYLSLTIEADGATQDDAPDHDRFTGKANSRSPSYTVWSDFCREAGIYELFYGQGWDRNLGQNKDCPEGFHRGRPLLDSHPGHAVLCQGDLDFVRHARERREATNGGKPPGFWDGMVGEVDNGNDPTLARLIWLEFWIDWAIKNCKVPILENS